MISLPKVVIVVAGGKGLRMNAEIPKQFIEINNKPILMHTLDIFHRYDSNLKLILVLPKDQINYWKSLCEKFTFPLSHQIVEGGTSRFHSVKNGLEKIQDDCLVAVHDGVRPLVSLETIDCCFQSALQYDTAVPTVELVDSIRKVTDDDSSAVDRNTFRLIQTPQVFKSNLLKKAYCQEYSSLFTDDASVVEAMGVKIKLVQGNRENIKITTEVDLKIAKAFI